MVQESVALSKGRRRPQRERGARAVAGRCRKSVFAAHAAFGGVSALVWVLRDAGGSTAKGQVGGRGTLVESVKGLGVQAEEGELGTSGLGLRGGGQGVRIDDGSFRRVRRRCCQVQVLVEDIGA